MQLHALGKIDPDAPVTTYLPYFYVADKRYKKITSDQIVVKENDLTIDSYYFTSQYLTNQRKQYTEKLKVTLDNSNDFVHVRLLIAELISYYKIPVKL